MTRSFIVLILLISAAVMMRGVASDWRKSPVLPTAVPAKKATALTKAAPLPQVKRLQPVVPAALPDLKQGYLFNQERTLADAKLPPPVGEESAVGGDTLGLGVTIDQVTYVGSIITEATSRAIIVYSAAAKPAARVAGLPPARFPRFRPPPAATSPPGAEEHARLELGDMLDGYEVAEILPDKLIFTKGGETVEKLLFDPDKKRQAPPPPPAARTPRPQSARGGRGASGQAGIQSTTIGGAATPAPAVANPSTPAQRALPPPTTRPAASGAEAAPTEEEEMPNSVRRMLMSRQRAPGSDPSTVPTGGSIPTPPAPGAE